MKQYWLSCDWGTTALRLRLIDAKNHQILSEYASQEGIARTYKAWKAKDAPPQYKLDFYRCVLKKHIEILANQAKKNLEGIDILLSGMASSSIGLYEMPYAETPFALDGSQANVYNIEADAQFSHNISLISGVKTDNDVIRGEETQLVGLAQLLPLNVIARNGATEGGAIIILPGTHSKHILLENNQLTNIHTFMTGEMFNLLTQHSILKDSIETINLDILSTDNLTAFTKGVLETDSSSLLHNLFKVRTNQIFNKMAKNENAFYLSGLLIGYELTPLLKPKNKSLVLCSGSNLYDFYKNAFDILGLSKRTQLVPVDILDKAVVIGQMKILHNPTLK
jgi:2-dehydro-3-deoxygalactonokinase